MKDLLNLEKKLSLDLEAVRKSIDLLGKNDFSKTENYNSSNNKSSDSVEFKNDPRELADVAEKYFNSVDNKPSTTREVKKFLEKEGAKIEGINKGSALGSALRGDKRFIFEKENKLWSLKK